eukprot:2698483-Amphidinium_carterae.3
MINGSGPMQLMLPSAFVGFVIMNQKSLFVAWSKMHSSVERHPGSGQTDTMTPSVLMRNIMTLHPDVHAQCRKRRQGKNFIRYWPRWFPDAADLATFSVTGPQHSVDKAFPLVEDSQSQ